jgi:hypothetical protein
MRSRPPPEPTCQEGDSHPQGIEIKANSLTNEKQSPLRPTGQERDSHPQGIEIKAYSSTYVNPSHLSQYVRRGTATHRE